MYIWIKVFHLVSMVAWFAGLFYIFRLYVYHVMNSEKREVTSVFEVMELKLLNIIIKPASIITLLTGSLMLYLNPILLTQGWIYVKLFFILILFAYQALAVHTYFRFKKKDFYLKEKTCRMLNEVPTVVLIVVVIMALLKPF